MENFRELLKKEIGWTIAIIMAVVACLTFFLKLPNQNKDAIIKLSESVINLRDNHIHSIQADVDELQGEMTNARVEIGQVKVLVEQLLNRK